MGHARDRGGPVASRVAADRDLVEIALYRFLPAFLDQGFRGLITEGGEGLGGDTGRKPVVATLPMAIYRAICDGRGEEGEASWLRLKARR